MISQPITCVCIYIANERKGTKIKIPNKISHLLGRKVNVNTLSVHCSLPRLPLYIYSVSTSAHGLGSSMNLEKDSRKQDF